MKLCGVVMRGSYEPHYSDMPDTDTVHYEDPNYPAVVAVDIDIRRIDRAHDIAVKKGFKQIAVYAPGDHLDYFIQRYEKTKMAKVFGIKTEGLINSFDGQINLDKPPGGRFFISDGRCVDVTVSEIFTQAEEPRPSIPYGNDWRHK